MAFNERRYFCEQLAAWLHTSEWHFTTLLAITIDTVYPLPKDVDQLVNDILQDFPGRPSVGEISDYLTINKRLLNWFNHAGSRPRVISLCLDRREPTGTLGKKLPSLANTKELAHWLGIAVNQLDWLADSWRRDSNSAARFNHYHYSLIEKRRGGMRLIESPKHLLKQVQRQINTEILSTIPIHDAAHGFCHQRGCLTHAGNHVGKKYLLLYDMAHCFHSIQWPMVYRVFYKSGYPKTVASYLTCLCTHQFNGCNAILRKLDHGQRRRVNIRHLAQGSPTSPALSNIVLYRLDKRLQGLADSLQLDYSRYADDLAFSGNQHRDWRFLETLVGSICMEEAFELNYRKTRILKSHQRQKLTGIVVNNKTNIDRRDYDLLKATLVNCVSNGLDSQNRERHNDFLAHLLGRINYVSTLNPGKGEKLRSIFDLIEGA